jgi:hypothetical protein
MKRRTVSKCTIGIVIIVGLLALYFYRDQLFSESGTPTTTAVKNGLPPGKQYLFKGYIFRKATDAAHFHELILRDNEVASNWVDRIEKEGNAVLIPGPGDTVVVVDHFGSEPSDYSRIQFADGKQGWVPDFELKDKASKKSAKHKKLAKNTLQDPTTRDNRRMASEAGH